MNEQIPVITIDGPGATGKGTICRLLAKWLGWHMLDSGLLYRALGFAALAEKISLEDEKALTALAVRLPVECHCDDPNAQTYILLNKQDITAALHRSEVSSAASQVGAHPLVREALLARQRAFLQYPGLVTDGRDMGTVVFPHAPLKLYLDAVLAIRAKRRFDQLKEQAISASLPRLLAELEARDTRDKNRQVAPLLAAVDAIHIDTSTLTKKAVLERIEAHIKDHFPQWLPS